MFIERCSSLLDARLAIINAPKREVLFFYRSETSRANNNLVYSSADICEIVLVAGHTHFGVSIYDMNICERLLTSKRFPAPEHYVMPS